MIKAKPNHEIASHTFSHYYCLEKGQDIVDFQKDSQAVLGNSKIKFCGSKKLSIPT